MKTIHSLAPIFLLLLLLSSNTNGNNNNDDYTIAPNNKSLLVALGCFWCAEQAFEQYAPGVIEAVSGYAGSNGNSNPTYHNHPGHYEVILIEYDPTKTSFELLVEYAFRNLDPFDTRGQFCDKGSSYLPAIFYANEEERLVVENVRGELLATYRSSWDATTMAVPIVERPTFWKAEEYHQNYYIKKPGNYGYYKQACGRTDRLKDVWGEEEYYCYHDLDLSCLTNGTVFNEEGVVVDAEVNVKNAPAEVVGLMPQWAIWVVSLVAVVLVCGLGFSCSRKVKS